MEMYEDLNKWSEDPTRIDMVTDPRKKRFVGIATHGNVKFDVPFMSELADNLWQGGCEDGLVLPDHIDHLVSLYPWESYTVNHTLKSSTSVRMYDSTKQGFDQVKDIAKWVIANRKSGPVFVHCQAGLNRSSLIAATVLMLDDKMSGEQAVEAIRSNRSEACLCNPAFLQWITQEHVHAD